MHIIPYYYFAINIIAFFVMYLDKRRAINGLWRIPENLLFLVALIGGAVGSYLGMLCFRHKTRKFSFRFGMPAFIILQVIFICVVYKTFYL